MGGIIAAGLPILLSMVKQAPGIIKSAEEMWEMWQSHDTPTPEQQAEFEAARQAAHKAAQEL